MTRFTLKQIDAFLAVGRTRSFAAAAEELCISQPSVSARIKELETALDVRVFERNGRSVSLTPEGQRLHKASLKLGAAIDEISELFVYPTDRQFNYRIGFTDGFFLSVIKDFSERSKSELPDVRLDIKVGVAEHINELLQRQSLDIGILPEPTSNDLLKCESLCVNELGWFARNGHPILSKKTEPSDLCDHDLMVYSFPSKIHQRATEWFKKNGINPKRLSSSRSLHNILVSVLYGNYVGLMPVKYVENADKEHIARRCIPSDPDFSLDLFVCWQRSIAERPLWSILDLVRQTAVGHYYGPNERATPEYSLVAESKS